MEHSEKLAEDQRDHEQRLAEEDREERDRQAEEDREQEAQAREERDRRAAEDRGLRERLAEEERDFLREQREEAEEHAERLAEQRRDDLANDWRLRAESMRQRAELKLRAGMVSDALDRLRKALAEDDTNYAVYETLCEAYWDAGDRDNWIRTMRDRLRFLPQSDQRGDPRCYFSLLGDVVRDPQFELPFRELLKANAGHLRPGEAFLNL